MMNKKRGNHMEEICKASVLCALRQKFQQEIKDAAYTSEVLQGGTVGDVVRLTGHAKTESNTLPFSIAVKTQRKWERHGDLDCWRREYEIYRQGLPQQLLQTIMLPRCYLLEEDEGATRIYMELIEGKTGNTQLHADELALAARKLGALQADFHLHGRKDCAYLRSFPAVHSSFDLWFGRMKPILQNPIDGFPGKMRQILNRFGETASERLRSFDSLPVTLCQGDVHHDNLILCDSTQEAEVYLIDWDSAGYGYMGEDAVDVLMEAFVYSDRDVSLFPIFRKKILNGYCEGAQNEGFPFALHDGIFRDLAALSWGFRVADLYLYYQDEPSKKRCIQILQAILEEEPS